MPRTSSSRQQSSKTLWEADQLELQAHVDHLLGREPVEPGWFASAFDGSWSVAFADAEVWCA